MTKTTLSEETQELLDEVYDVELALEFIENHGETEFQTYYEKYEELVKEYGQNLIDEFAENYEEIISVNVRNVEIPEPETV